jgi:hypothetical protein
MTAPASSEAALSLETADTVVVKPLQAAAAEERMFRRSFKLIDLVEQRLDLAGVRFPVLVSRPGSSTDEIESSTVHVIANLPARPVADEAAALPDELGRLTIGRTPENDIPVDEVTVSRRHGALIRRAGDQWSLVDEGSLNGTFLDGDRLAARAPVALTGPISTIRVGSRCRFALMSERSFRDHLGALAATLATQRSRSTVAGQRALAPTAPRVAPAWTDAPDEFAGAKILDAARKASFPVKLYRAALPDALVEEFDDWADFVAFVERNAARIQQLEVCPDEGRGTVVYRCDHTTELAFPRPERAPVVNRSA